MIYGDRLRLRAIERTDLPSFVQWLNDPQVRLYLSLDLPISQAAEEQWFEAMLNAPAEERPLAIEVQEGDTWKLIGNAGFSHIDWRARSAEIGLFIGEKSYWDKGHGTQVMQLLLRHGFETLNLNRIFLHVLAENQRAIRCYEKVGFVLEGRLRQAAYRRGNYQDVLVMSMLRAEWNPAGWTVSKLRLMEGKTHS
jgi:RimJ/RimL family protein N-acetyltransferase